MEYLKNLVKYLGHSVDKWANELQELVDSPGFDFLELKPIFSEPQPLVQYVTRSKNNHPFLSFYIVPLFIHMICAIICLGSSAFYHLFKDHSEMYHKTLVRMDYAGISIMIAGSNTSPLFYSFFCEELHGKFLMTVIYYYLGYRNLYLGLMYFFCFSAFVVFLVPRFDQPRYRVLRGTTFVICGLLSALPLFHIEFFTDQKYLNDFLTFPWAFGGALYIFGAILYMMKIPERFMPGFFDIFGHSHQFFHFLIVAAAFVHYSASVETFHNRQLHTCPVKALDDFRLSQQNNSL